MSQLKAVETSREALQKWANDVFTLLNLGDHAHQRNTFVAVLAECGENLLRGQGRLSPEAVPEREWLERINQYVTGEAGSMHASLSSAQILHDIHEMTESALEGKSTKLTPSAIPEPLIADTKYEWRCLACKFITGTEAFAEDHRQRKPDHLLRRITIETLVNSTPSAIERVARRQLAFLRQIDWSLSNEDWKCARLADIVREELEVNL